MTLQSKKYIAGILTIALAAGVCQSYGSMEAMAKENTLPGIEKLVDDKINTEGNIFHILEVVPSTENASIGYFIGGEEPIAEGRKLSELPSQTERLQAMQDIRSFVNDGKFAELVGEGKALDFSAYEEKENAAHTAQLRGSFIRREDGTGRYNYVGTDAVYAMLADGEEYIGTRYERYSSFPETNVAIAGAKCILPTLSMVSGSTGKQLQTVIDQNGEKTYAYTTGRYALTNYQNVPNGRMDSIDTAAFQPGDYAGMEVWKKSGSTDNPHYTYLGVIAFGASLPENCTIDGSSTTSVTSGDAVVQSVTGNNAVALSGISTQQLPEGIGQNLYVLNKGNNAASLWAHYNDNTTGGVYSFQPVADGYFLQFMANEAGEYYVSDATLCDGDSGEWKLVDEYRESDTGRYKKVQDGNVQVLVRGENGFDPLNTYDFIGDAKADSIGSIIYNGGFSNREWFKKYVLNLSDDDVSKMQIEVTTLTVQELADLAEKQTYCGLDLSDVDMIYLSGQGEYQKEPENAAYLANTIARLGFGIESDKDNAQSRNNSVRIPVVMDYGFYEKNSTAQNAVLTRLAITLLRVSDADVYNALVKEQLDYWNESNSTIKNAVCLDNVDKELASLAGTQQITDAAAKTLVDVKAFLVDNVYLNDDSSKNAKAYVASDFLTDFSQDVDRAWVYAAVLREIQYENFLLQKDGETQTTGLKEEISKASVTRYILNWYLHRVLVKSELKVLDLEPCYDFGQDALTEARVKELMGLGDTYQGTIEITQMASTEFIGKVEDLNACYDLIYVGARCGNMNTDVNGDTVYNDSNMNGLIYTHVGDAYDYSGESDNNKLRLRDDSLQHTQNQYDDTLGDAEKAKYTYRGPGNDMNSTKLEEFKQYIQAGYPVVFADKFLKVEGGKVAASTRTLDSNSYFYQLVKFALTTDESGNYLYWQKNVYAESQLKNVTVDTLQKDDLKLDLTTTLKERQNTFCNYLNLSKLTLSWVTDLGEAYRPDALYSTGANTGDQYSVRLQPIDGEYRLQYIFSLSNDAALFQLGTTYDCRLFVDKNSDGRFAGSEYTTGGTGTATEELTGLEIYVRSGDTWEKVQQVATENGSHYELRTGSVYKVSRVLPDDFTGVLPWKLVLYDNADRLVRTAVSDYTAVPTGSGRKQLSILQILSDNRNKQTYQFENNNWILDNDNCGDFDYLYNRDYSQFGKLKDDQKTKLNNLADANSTFRQYISDLKDYDISVHSVYVSDLIASIDANINIKNDWHYQTNYDYIRVRQQKAYEYFQQYDMLIVGFADTLQLGSDYYSGEASKSLLEGKENDNVPDQNMAVARAIRDYVESGKSILFTHDTSSYIAYMDAAAVDSNWYWGYEFNRSMRAALGLDRYGALQNYYTETADELLKQSPYWMSDSKRALYDDYRAYAEKLNQDREGAVYNYDELKEPNIDMVLGQKEGLTKYTVVRFMTKKLEALRLHGKVDNFYFPVNNDLLSRVGFNNGSSKESVGTSSMLDGTYMSSNSEPKLKVTEVNDGQITKYPYLITDEEQKSLTVNSTHYQWLQPNMELDKDGDGKNDIVVWYTLSDLDQSAGGRATSYIGNNIYSIDPRDVVNNYYIYSMGNVTYSGAGHRVPENTAEMKLFVNTIVAAYSAGVKAPKAEFQDNSGNQISSIYMIYDEQNHIVLRQSGENQDEVQVRFKVTDYNVMSGERQTYVEFYKACNENDANGITVDGIVGKVIPLTVKGVADASGAELTGSGDSRRYNVSNGGVYSLTYDLSEMGLFGKDTSSDVTLESDASPAVIYLKAYTVYNNGTEQTPIATAQLSVSVEKLFDLN